MKPIIAATIATENASKRIDIVYYIKNKTVELKNF